MARVRERRDGPRLWRPRPRGTAAERCRSRRDLGGRASGESGATGLSDDAAAVAGDASRAGDAATQLPVDVTGAVRFIVARRDLQPRLFARRPERRGWVGASGAQPTSPVGLRRLDRLAQSPRAGSAAGWRDV